MTLQEAQWATQQPCPPMRPASPQGTVWDEGQNVGFLPRRPHVHLQNVFYNPYVQPHRQRDLAAQVRLLQQHYAISGNDRFVMELLEIDPTLYTLLTEAVQPLKRAFGDSLLRIRVQNADDDSLLKVAVQIPPEFATPEAALQSFDNEWWINNCHRSTGTLVFDYERRDAI